MSKWETGTACSDIFLLPDIARFYGITVDELLQVKQLDEQKLYMEYEAKAADLCRIGKLDEALALWLEAHKRMPNNIEVKEMLMSNYFDIDRNRDKKKYFNEFVELATEIYNSENVSGYYKGQAISELARAYAENGNTKLAQNWASKSISLFNSREIIYSQIDSGDDLISDVNLRMFWFLEELFYLAARIDGDAKITLGAKYKQGVFKVVSRIYETVYINDDMGFKQLQHLYNMYMGIAEYETGLDNDEAIVRANIERALDCVVKSMSVIKHELTHPMLYGWHVSAAPSDNKINLRFMKNALSRAAFDSYKDKKWFVEIKDKLNTIIA